MKAKGLVTLALPVMLLTGCTTETYGLTQAEFKQVDKEFKADKMIEDMKRLHYSDEEIEKQLRGALATIKSEKEEKKNEPDKKSEVKTESYSREGKTETNKSGYDNDVEGYPTDKLDKSDREMVKLSEKEYPYRLFELLVDFQYDLKGIEKESELMVAEDELITYPTLDYINRARTVLDEFEKINPPKKYKEYQETIIPEVIGKSRKGLDRVEEAVRKYEEKRHNGTRLKEELEKGMNDITGAQSLYEPMFREFDHDYPDARKKALDKLRNEVVDSASRPSIEDDTDPKGGIVELSTSGKELVGEWNSYKFEKYHVGFDFKEDGSYTMYDSEDKEIRKKNYLKGKWRFNAGENRIILSTDKIVEDGKSKSEDNLPPNATFMVTSFTNDSFGLQDERGSLIKAKKRK